MDLQFAVDKTQVNTHSFRGDAKTLCDLSIGKPLRQQIQNILLANA